MFDNWKKWWKQFKLGMIKWCDFLSAFCLLFFGSIICGIIVFLGPQPLMTPIVAIVLGGGMIIAPIFFRFVSSLTIQVGLHETYSNFTTLFILVNVFAVLLFLAVRKYINPSMAKDIMSNLGNLNKIPACLAGEVSSQILPPGGLQGLQQGLQQGVQQGVHQGVQQGVSGLQNTMQTAVNTSNAAAMNTLSNVTQNSLKAVAKGGSDVCSSCS